MRRLLLVGATALVAVAGASAADAAALPRWTVDAAPFRLSFLAGQTPLTREALPPALPPGPGSRLSYETEDGTRHSLTTLVSREPVPGGERYTVATDEPGRTATVVVQRLRGSVRVRWSLTPATGVTTVYEALTARPGEHFLGGGENESFVDLAGEVVPLTTWHPCRTYTPTPLFVSSRGYGLAVTDSSIGRAELAGTHDGSTCGIPAEPECPLVSAPTEIQLCFRAAKLDYEVYTGSPAQVLDAYTRDTGRPMLPPPSEFGLIKWRDIVSGPAEVLDDVTTLRSLAVPVEWVLLDNPWERSLCYGTLEFGPPHFPDDPRTMIDAVHRLGVKFMLWVSPYVRRLPGCPYPVYPIGGLVGPGDSQALDLTQPAVFAEFVARLRALAALGVDGVKADRADEIDLERERLAAGPGIRLQNLYPYLYDLALRTAFGSGPGRTWAGIVRAAAPQSRALVPGLWAGDQEGTWDGLERAIRAAATAGASGFPVWGSDIGGYASDNLTPEVFVRWAQLGAVSPIFEVGGTGRNATFWDFGPRTVSRFRDAAILHYELFPYLYELAREAAATGAPVLRPLAFDFPADPGSWQADLELLVGPSLLALPVTVPSPALSHEYFPPGRWISVWAGGYTVDGPTSFDTLVPPARLPLYLRAGSAVPFDFRTPLVWRERWAVNDLDRPGRLGWLYAPGPGTTHARSADERLAATASGGRIALTLTGPRRELQLLVLTPRTPRRILVDGEAVPRRPRATGLRPLPSGWTLDRDRFEGVVVKVTATGPRTNVTITF